jgi:hypothetical protein
MFDIERIVSFRFGDAQPLHEERLRQGLTYLGGGRHRRTYLSPNKRYVLKFPRNTDGVIVNTMEARAWKRCFNQPDGNGQCYAPCRLIKGTVLMMRTVVELFGRTDGCDSARGSGELDGTDAHDDDAPELPDWCDQIDSTQVGYLANGRLVAYDYGSSC